MKLPEVEGGWDVVYADPPWSYDNPPPYGRDVENHYPTMSVSAIAEMPVGEISAPNSALFLWATSPLLTQALQVMDAWGFTYRSNAVWVKDKVGCGYWFRQQHELLLVGLRGKSMHPPPELRRSSVFDARRAAHSHKPWTVAEWIEQAYQMKDKLELFAREERPGWTAWGNELRQCVMPMEEAR